MKEEDSVRKTSDTCDNWPLAADAAKAAAAKPATIKAEPGASVLNRWKRFVSIIDR